MTDPNFADVNIRIAKHLIDKGAIGARLISAEQFGNAAFRIQMQTHDDRRIEVVFRTDVQIKSSMEIQPVNAGENAEPKGS